MNLSDHEALKRQLAALPLEVLAYVDWQRRWTETARPPQIPPKTDWSECGYLAGRGFGKTRVGAEWITRAGYEDPSGFDSCVIAPTYQDVKITCFEGESGILSVLPPELLVEHNKTDMVIRLRNIAGGVSTIRGFTAEKPERLRGPQHTRAWCFVAGTLVATPQGDVPIETLRPGDVVLTRKGARRVSANSCREAEVGSVKFSTGAVLLGTTDHPVYTPAGWTDLSRLRVGDEVCAIAVWNGVANGGIATGTGITSELTSPSRRSGLSGFIELSGRARTAISQMVGKFTTVTRTLGTTLLPTLSASRLASIAASICRANPSLSLTGSGSRLSSAIAPIAARRSNASDPARSPFAPSASASVLKLGASAPVFARTAARTSNPAPETSAASVASTWQPQGLQPVYCLKVEGEPEYFANGILVHNCDELAAWQYDQDTWDMAMMGMRLGERPQVLWTTTPKPKEMIRKLSAPKAGRVIIRGSTFDNRANLPQSFFDQLEQYEGTTLGRQEIYGELIDPEESGIVKRSQFRLWPAAHPLPKFEFIVMSLDTAFTEKTYDKKSGDSDSTACVVMGVFFHEKRFNAMVLDCWEDQLGMPALIRRVRKEMNTPYGDDDDVALIKPLFGSSKPLTSGHKPDVLLIEDKGSGISLRQMLEAEGIDAYAYNPGRADKLTRLHMVTPALSRKLVWLPESDKHPGRPRNWIEPMLAQLCAFTGPGSIKHDDYVDAFAQALRLMMDKRWLDPVKAKKDERDTPPPKVVVNPYTQ